MISKEGRDPKEQLNWDQGNENTKKNKEHRNKRDEDVAPEAESGIRRRRMGKNGGGSQTEMQEDGQGRIDGWNAWVRVYSEERR